MRTRRLAVVVSAASLLVPSVSFAQNVKRLVRIIQSDPPPAETPAESAAENGASESSPRGPKSTPLLYLRDGSKVAGVPKLEVLEVRTRYGLLRIPPSELTRVRFAQRVDPKLTGQIDALIKQLGDEDFERREAAMSSLREIGLPSLSRLQVAASSGNEEIQDRARLLVDELETQQKESSNASDSLPQLGGTEDEIGTERMTVKGMVLTEVFSVDTRYGELTIRIADLKGIAFRPPGSASASVEITPTFQPPGNWLDTKVSLERGQDLRIEAGGSIQVSNYGIASGPTGTSQWGGSGYGGFHHLALIGRIGKNGKPFVVGNKYKSKTKKPGLVYLAVVPFAPYPQGATGSYHVKIRVSGGE